jgi:decaprenyl-phosphate phosphoribosyltransferase
VITDTIRLIRLRQSPKNLLVLSAPIAAGKITIGSVVLDSIALVVAFTLASSGIYALNDVMDRNHDRIHPKKQYRPIASGAISPRRGLCIASMLLIAGVAIAVTVGLLPTMIIAIYILLNLLYSSGLKDVPVLELMIVASGFVLRVIVGLLVTPGPRTPGFLQTVFFGSLLVVVGKRVSEQLVASGSRPVLKDYPTNFLLVSLAISATAFLGTYIDFAFTQVGNTWQPADFPMGLTVIPILFLTLELVRLAILGESGEPEVLFWRNRRLTIAGVAFLVLYSAYLGGW